MKKKKIFITLSIILAIGTIGYITIKNPSDVNAAAVEPGEVNFTKQGVFKELEDNWIYSFDILYYPSNTYYVFDGYNLKYTRIDGYYDRTINIETGEVVKATPAEVPSLARSAKEKDDQIKINQFFNEKKFTEKINLNDLKDLELSTIEKEIIMDMFNKTLDAEIVSQPGQYIYDSYLRKVTVDSSKDEKGKWELTYINDYGYLKYVTFDFIYDDNTYLTDNNMDYFKELEESIEKNQCFDCEANLEVINKFPESDQKDLKDLLIKAREMVEKFTLKQSN